MQAIEDRTAYRNDVCAAGQCFEHMRATAYATIEDDRHTLVHNLGNRRQDVEGRRAAVELTATMVGHPDRRGAGLDCHIGVFG
ncbi:hypothetical protein D3C87_2084280 [compost metagenome]